MLNIILDGFPDEYEGYLIRTDFRVGMQISEALNDVDLAKPEKMMTALRLLYGNGIPPDSDVAESGLRWFMAGGNPDEEHIPDGKPPTFDFEQDNRLLYSAFRARYGIDLTREGLHWFAFLAMLGDLGGLLALGYYRHTRHRSRQARRGTAERLRQNARALPDQGEDVRGGSRTHRRIRGTA